MNRILLFIGKTIVWWVILTVAVVLGGGYLLVIAPKLSTIQGSTSRDVAEKQARLQEQEEESQALRSLEENLKTVSAAEQRRLEAVLPSAAELDDLYIQFTDLAASLGLSMTSLEFSDAGSSATAEEKQNVGGDIQTVGVTFSVDGVESYEALKTLLTTLQDNLRILDMNSLAYSPGTTQYSLTLKLYYFDEGKEKTPDE